MGKLSVTLALCLAILLQGCMPQYLAKDVRIEPQAPQESDFWWGVAATSVGAGIALASAQSGQDQFGAGLLLGGVFVLGGVDRFARYYSAKFWYPRLKPEPPVPSNGPVTREAELAKARQAETEGRWANAWGAYRRAKDLGPPSQFIEEKLLEMEGKLAVEREKVK